MLDLFKYCDTLVGGTKSEIIMSKEYISNSLIDIKSVYRNNSRIPKNINNQLKEAVNIRRQREEFI